MTIVKEEKETFWGRVKSRFGKIWSWVSSKFSSGWKSFTSLFSGNKSKATVVAESSNVITPTEGQVGAVQQQVIEPNMETPPQQPEDKTPKSVNPPEIAEEAEKGELEKDGNNGSPNPEETDDKGNPQGKSDLPKKPVPVKTHWLWKVWNTSTSLFSSSDTSKATDAKSDAQEKTSTVVPKKRGIVGFIKTSNTSLKLVVRKGCKSLDKSDIVQNDGYKAYVKIGGEAYCVIVNPHSTIVGKSQSFLVHSVLTITHKYKVMKQAAILLLNQRDASILSKE